MPPPAEIHTGADSDADDAAVETEDNEVAEEGLGRDGAKVSSAAAGRPPACCSLCMDPWTCYDAHRIWHVYGKSCLVRWLQHCGNTSAKCPQCREQFELKNIIDLYAPGDLLDGCCRMQEIKALVIAQVSEATVTKVAMELQSRLDEAYAKNITALLSNLTKTYQEQLDRDVGAMVKTFVSMKEQMKKMAEQNATPMDLIEFVEQSYAQLPIPSHPPPDGTSEVVLSARDCLICCRNVSL
ncbi:unnamed protein product [Urochloa decumbens]|uniref:RING-type domain-containing protein n=1 Tax=Urochloa decumbens TaxID=240449 RepID=A0ABC8XV72_9POAL